MGMFDTVWAACPRCDHSNELQTKSGPCRLDEYDVSSAPTEVIAGVLGDHHCTKCHKRFSIQAVTMAQIVAKDTDSED
jgi:hypothetical protein